MTAIMIDLSFSYGECTLMLSSAAGTASIKNHWVNAKFTQLVNGVSLLLDGVESVSCRWQGPVQEGHFIDLVTDPAEGISVAVHKFRYPEGNTYAEIWSAERGGVVFATHLPMAEFALAFAAALRRVRATAVDSSGMIKEYPRPFPYTAFEQIEERATRLGYQPVRLEEIDGP